MWKWCDQIISIKNQNTLPNMPCGYSYSVTNLNIHAWRFKFPRPCVKNHNDMQLNVFSFKSYYEKPRVIKKKSRGSIASMSSSFHLYWCVEVVATRMSSVGQSGQRYVTVGWSPHERFLHMEGSRRNMLLSLETHVN